MNHDRQGILADLYLAAGLDERKRGVLDELVEGAGLGWRCRAKLPFDQDLSCEYLNVPTLRGDPADAPCVNCGAPRPEEATDV